MAEDLVKMFKEIEAGVEPASEPEPVEAEAATEPEPEPVEETPSDEKEEGHEEGQRLLAKPEDREDKRKLLAELAKDLGLHVSEARVEPAERIKWREEKRREKEELKRLQDEHRGRIEFAQRVETARKLFEDGETDAALKEVFGATLEDANRREVERIRGRDPKVAKLEKELEALRQREQQAAQERESRAAQERVAQERSRYIGHVGEALGKVDEFKIFASEPEFIEAVVSLQEKAYDPDDNSTIGADVAARAVISDLRKQYEKLTKHFGVRDSLTPEKPTRDGSAPVKRHKTITGKTATVEPGKRSFKSDDEFFKFGLQQLREATD